METLNYHHIVARRASGSKPHALVGVVASGNLEVLVESSAGATCRVDVDTSARGFGAIWEAVLRDFHARHGIAGVTLSIHDMGATPAVVSLRLDQAMSAVRGAPP